MRAIVAARAAILCLACLPAACAPRPDIELQRAILASAVNESAINFTRIVAEDWDRMCVIPPYTRPEIARDATETSWRGFERSGIKMRDDVNLLVFLDGDDVVRSALVGRGADFDVREVTCVSAGSARWIAHPRSRAEPGMFTLTLARD
jgi:hypothetical protein